MYEGGETGDRLVKADVFDVDVLFEKQKEGFWPPWLRLSTRAAHIVEGCRLSFVRQNKVYERSACYADSCSCSYKQDIT